MTCTKLVDLLQVLREDCVALTSQSGYSNASQMALNICLRGTERQPQWLIILTALWSVTDHYGVLSIELTDL